MRKALLFAALFGCLLALSAAEDGPDGSGTDDQDVDEQTGDPSLGNDDSNLAPNQVKDGEAAGHHGGGHGGHHHRHHHHRHHHHRGFGHGYGFGYGRRHNRYVERSTCSVQASYWLSVNRERRYCIDAVQEHDDCQACCEAATRRETRGVDKDDVTGFITVGGQYGPAPYRSKREASYGKDKGNDDRGFYREKECVCCVPNKHRHHNHYWGGYGGYGGY